MYAQSFSQGYKRKLALLKLHLKENRSTKLITYPVQSMKSGSELNCFIASTADVASSHGASHFLSPNLPSLVPSEFPSSE